MNDLHVLFCSMGMSEKLSSSIFADKMTIFYNFEVPMSCPETEELIRDARFRTILGSQCLAGVLSIIVSSMVLKRCTRLYFHINCRILIAAMLIVYTVYSILVVGMQLSAVIERCIALWKRSHYDSFGPKIGFSLVFMSVLLAVLSGVWAMYEEDFSQQYAYCSRVTPNTTRNMMILTFASSGVSASTIFIIAILLVFNNVANRRVCVDLTTSYQLRENNSVLRLHLPLVVFQAAISGFVATSGAITMMFRNQLSPVNYRVILASSNVSNPSNAELKHLGSFLKPKSTQNKPS
ncbi:hypothetical protein COOONC_04521 [Cooperia oncophora]